MQVGCGVVEAALPFQSTYVAGPRDRDSVPAWFEKRTKLGNIDRSLMLV